MLHLFNFSDQPLDGSSRSSAAFRMMAQRSRTGVEDQLSRALKQVSTAKVMSSMVDRWTRWTTCSVAGWTTSNVATRVGDAPGRPMELKTIITLIRETRCGFLRVLIKL